MYLIPRSLFYLFLLISISSCSKPQDIQVAEKPLFVKFEEASIRPVSLSFETAGEIKADEEILVAAERQGQVEKIFVKEGAWVKTGTPLVSIKGNDVVSDLKKAEADYASYKKLYEEGAISQLEYIQYEANLSKTKSQMSNLNITAITSGIIGEIYIDLGDYVIPGNKILDLVKLYPLRLSYSIPERLLSKVAIGQTVNFTTDSAPGEVFSAKVDFISPKVDPMSRTILVRALVDTSNEKLKANQFVTIKQVIKDIPNALMVREEAVYLDQGAEYLYLADISEELGAQGSGLSEDSEEVAEPRTQNPEPPQYIARRVEIKTGLREPGWVQILDGIEAGDNVIYAGLTMIYPGAKLVRVMEKGEEKSSS